MQRTTVLFLVVISCYLLTPGGRVRAQEAGSGSGGFFSNWFSGGGNTTSNSGDFGVGFSDDGMLSGGGPRPEWGNTTAPVNSWTMTIGAAILSRQHDSNDFLRINGMAGVKLDAIRRMGTFDLEFGWQGLNSGSDPRMFTLPAGSTLAITPPFVQTADALAFRDRASSLNSFEFNARLPGLDWFTGIAGLRYINLDEQFSQASFSNTQMVYLDSRVSNNLFGMQLGGDAKFLNTGIFYLNTVGKAGVYANHALHDFSLAANSPLGITSFRDQHTHVAMQAEFELAGVLQVTKLVALRFGYQVIWIDRVGLAGNQLDQVNLVSRSGLDTHSAPLWHGAIVQGQMGW